MIVNASRSWAPTPTSSRTAPVCGSSTTRQTSRPRTSPVTTPCSTFGTAPPATIVSTSARCAGAAAGGASSGSPTAGSSDAAVDVPDLDREADAGGAPRERARVALGEQVERRGPVADRPRQRRTEAAPGSSSASTHAPPSAVRAAPGGNVPGRRVEVVTEVVTDERVQLDAAQAAAPAALVDVGHAAASAQRRADHLAGLRAP